MKVYFDNKAWKRWMIWIAIINLILCVSIVSKANANDFEKQYNQDQEMLKLSKMMEERGFDIEFALETGQMMIDVEKEIENNGPIAIGKGEAKGFRMIAFVFKNNDEKQIYFNIWITKPEFVAHVQNPMNATIFSTKFKKSGIKDIKNKASWYADFWNRLLVIGWDVNLVYTPPNVNMWDKDFNDHVLFYNTFTYDDIK